MYTFCFRWHICVFFISNSGIWSKRGSKKISQTEIGLVISSSWLGIELLSWLTMVKYVVSSWLTIVMSWLCDAVSFCFSGQVTAPHVHLQVHCLAVLVAGSDGLNCFLFRPPWLLGISAAFFPRFSYSLLMFCWGQFCFMVFFGVFFFSGGLPYLNFKCIFFSAHHWYDNWLLYSVLFGLHCLGDGLDDVAVDHLVSIWCVALLLLDLFEGLSFKTHDWYLPDLGCFVSRYSGCLPA